MVDNTCDWIIKWNFSFTCTMDFHKGIIALFSCASIVLSKTEGINQCTEWDCVTDLQNEMRNVIRHQQNTQNMLNSVLQQQAATQRQITQFIQRHDDTQRKMIQFINGQTNKQQQIASLLSLQQENMNQQQNVLETISDTVSNIFQLLNIPANDHDGRDESGPTISLVEQLKTDNQAGLIQDLSQQIALYLQPSVVSTAYLQTDISNINNKVTALQTLVIRLTGGHSRTEGRVEVFYDNEWGSVCDDLWDDDDASVVCRQLGLKYENAVAVKGAYFGPGSGNIHLDRVECEGNEESLWSCDHVTRPSDCDHENNAGVRCQTIRLVNGSDIYEGRVEILRDGEWGTISDSKWDDRNAQVVCRELGLPYENAISTIGADFGQGIGRIWLHSVNCNGSEGDLLSCEHKQCGSQSNCDHSNDVGAICEQPIRLVNGSNSYEGRVEFWHGDTWGTVCSNSWDDFDASIICRKLGLPNDNAEAKNPGYFGQGSGLIHCSGSEDGPRMFSCERYTWTSENCIESISDVGVVCHTIRLVNGVDKYEGHVQVWHDNQWASVCGKWGNNEVKVACRQLGFAYKDSFPVTYNAIEGYGDANSTQSWLDGLQCLGSELHLSSCEHDAFRNGLCNQHEIVDIVCEQPIRLTGGNIYQGRLEVWNGESWGPVCALDWHYNNTMVVCRQLGLLYDTFEPVSWIDYYEQDFNKVEDQFGLINVNCSGSEENIWFCEHQLSYLQQFHGPYVGVVCQYPVRLINGINEYEGLVEVWRDGNWGKVCGDHWGIDDAKVICRQLGFSYENIEVKGHLSDEESGKIWTYDFGCTGFEGDIWSCQNIEFETCYSIASVVCNPPIRLVNGSGYFEGRLEVWRNDQWATVCDNYTMSGLEADMICNTLGLKNGFFIRRGGYFGEGNGAIYGLDYSGCITSTYKWQCGYMEWNLRDSCDHSDDIGVVCSVIRLVNDRDYRRNYEGRVEVWYNGSWGSICDSDWDDKDAQVVCNQLGFPISPVYLAQSKTGAFFGQSSGQIWLDNVDCNGSERSIWSCNHSGWGVSTTCDHSRDAGVTCQMFRLVNGSDKFEGRVEVWNRYEWISLCYSDPKNIGAQLLCHQLGLPNENAEIILNSYFGESTATRVLRFNTDGCYRIDENLSECASAPFSWIYKQGCLPEYRDVGVLCH